MKRNKKPPYFSNHLQDQDSDLFSEEYFQERLSLERKRTERSQKPFVLMLLNIEKIIRNDPKREIVKKITHKLFSVTRGIDIKGWFKYDSVIGIIFIEINGTDKNGLKEKIVNLLRTVLDNEQVAKIEITCHLFPEDNGKQRSDNVPDLNFYPDITKRNSSKRISRFMKRVLDIVGSIIALFIFSPFFLIIPILIKISSEGTIFFRQERLGQFGEKFTFLKFRTMYVDNDPTIHKEYLKKFISEQKSYEVEKNGDIETSIYKIKDDPRITPIGRFLRKTSLDEFPQFFNVLKGEMSLVGPRPPIPYELENYDIWHLRRILEIRPGITGLWQVKGRSSTTFDEMVRMDLRYIRNWSVWLDVKILIQTPLAVLTSLRCHCKGQSPEAILLQDSSRSLS
jgi:exopolysaccharide biosynthesis polyprenyl glycosylphosphotransferase